MILFYIGIILLCFYGMKTAAPGRFHDDFLSKDQCNAIKGFFIVFVFIRHVLQYVRKSGYDFSSAPDTILSLVDRELDQLIVVMFLFYSGYGIMESIKKKGLPYIKGMPLKRILPTILNFDIAVLFFLATAIILDTDITITQVLLSLTGWDSLGNSNWYIFAIVILYFITWLSFFLTNKQKNSSRNALAMSIGLCFVLLFVLYLHKETFWYNTLFAYISGTLVSFHQSKLIPLFKKYFWPFFALFLILIISCKLVHHDFMCLKFNIMSITFAFTIMLFTMKVKIQNNILIWLGSHLFPLYIYQRIVMIVLYNMDDGLFVKNHPIAFVSLSFATMIVWGFLFKYWDISPRLSPQKSQTQKNT